MNKILLFLLLSVASYAQTTKYSYTTVVQDDPQSSFYQDLSKLSDSIAEIIIKDKDKSDNKKFNKYSVKYKVSTQLTQNTFDEAQKHFEHELGKWTEKYSAFTKKDSIKEIIKVNVKNKTYTKFSTNRFVKGEEENNPFSVEFPLEYNPNKILKKELFNNETKTILGQTCFKVVFEVENRDIFSDYDLTTIPENFNTKTYTLWLSKNIKSVSHPIVNFKEILELGYPLQIEVNESLLKGRTLIYTATIL